MKKRAYNQPRLTIVRVATGSPLLGVSTPGMPQDTDDGLWYSGPSGSFDGDESVASRRRSLWDEEEE